MRSIHRLNRHRQHTVTAIVAFVSCSLFPSLAAAAGKCKDIPLRVTIYSNAVTDPVTGATVPAALQSDGGGEYVDGVSASALIMICSGTHDAVVNLSSSRRTFTFVFGAPIAGSVVEAAPAWAPGQYA